MPAISLLRKFALCVFLAISLHVQSQNANPVDNTPQEITSLNAVGNPDDTVYQRSYYSKMSKRKALVKPVFKQECEETGIVVVDVHVNRQGKVIQAVPGVEGTTNMAPCLLAPAKKAAWATIFSKDEKAPEVQIGRIYYRF